MSDTEALPTFRYHPDPITSGSVEPSEGECAVCGEARGFIYVGPVYGEDDLSDAVCPWCIADGSAFAEHDATFVDSEAFDDDAPQAAMDEIVERTPGFATYQSERWPSCCGEPAAFLEPAGITEIRTKYRYVESQLMPYIVHEMGISGGAATRLLESLKRDSSPTAFIFRCLHCDTNPAWIDRT